MGMEDFLYWLRMLKCVRFDVCLLIMTVCMTNQHCCHTHLNKMIIKLHIVIHPFSEIFYKIKTSETMVWL
jgi:hypothetical protein